MYELSTVSIVKFEHTHGVLRVDHSTTDDVIQYSARTVVDQALQTETSQSVSQ